MAKEAPPQDLMHYDAMVHDALRGVVKSALKRAASPGGLPGEHHFYITFKTDAPGVSGPDDLLAKYPEEMTIVLQHQYWDLAPGETYFVVTLKFGGEPKKLSIPYAALTRFYDPSVQFLLTFEPAAAAEPEPAPATLPKPKAVDAAKDNEPDKAKEDGGEEPKVVSLDQFRKK